MEAQGDELRALRQQLEDEQLETARLKELLSDAESKVARSRDDLAAQRLALEDKEAEFSAQLATMQTDQDRVQLQASQRAIAAQRERIAGLEEALDKAEEQKALFQALASDAGSNADRIATLNAHITMLEQQSTSRETEFQSMQASLDETRKELERVVAAANAASSASEAELAARNAEIERLRAVVTRAEQETSRHQGDIDRLSAQSDELETLRENLEREQAQSNRLQDLLTESQDRFAATNRRLAAATSARAELEEEVAALERQLADGDASAKELINLRTSDIQTAQQEIDALRAQIEESEAEFKRYEGQVADTAERQRDAIRELREAVAQSRAERSQLEEQLQSVNAQYANAQADLQVQRERFENLQDELREARAGRRADENQLSQKQRELDAEQARVKQLLAEVDRLTRQSQRYEEQLHELEAVAQAKKVDFAGPKIVMLEPDEESLQALANLTRGGGEQMTRGISVVAASSTTETRIIRGHVEAAAGLAELTIDGWKVPFDSHNAFSQTLKLDSDAKHIRIEAVDHNGKRDIKEFEYRVGGEVFSKDDRFPHPRNGALDELRYYALLIANQDYEDDGFMRDLQTPIADVEAIAHVLEQRYGFEVKILRDADKETMEQEFERIFFHEPSDDNLENDKDGILIYYAGHGLLSDSRRDNAYYWAPVDAMRNSPRTWFETYEIERYMKNAPTAQIMVVADSCFAGKVLSRDGDGMLPVSEYSAMFEEFLWEYTQNKKSRFVLTSGGMAPVLDGGGGSHSVFARSFLEVLRNNEGIISAHTLFENVSPKVMYLAKKQSFDQEPEFGYLRSAGHESGVFYLPAPLYPSQMSASMSR